MSNGLCDLEEDFEGAYKSRLREFLYLKQTEDEGYEVLLMHLGGIIIECYLKYLIVKKFKIEKFGFGKWLSDASVQKAILEDGHNLKKQTVRLFADVERPEHSLIDCFKKLPEFNEVLLLDTDILEKLRNVSNPLNTKEDSFIDLRYRSSKCFEDNSTKFDIWLQDFRSIYNWIDEHKRNIEVVG